MGSEKTDLIQAPIEPVQSGPLLDMRRGFLSMTPENMSDALAEYDERRKVFRDWLKSKLVEGTHYGFPPGCLPESSMMNGEIHYRSGKNWYPASQWTPKPSLYKPTADMLCEMLALRDEYDADMEAWKQLGEPKGTFVMRCRLYSLTSGKLIGEGRGVRKNGQKGGDENNAIKMAKKSAKLDAVINALGISDLFTQDMDSPPETPPIYENPTADDKAPKAQPRTDRVTQSDLLALKDQWKHLRERQGLQPTKEAFAQFFEGATGLPPSDALKPTAWSQEDLEKCRKAIKVEMDFYREPGDEP